MYYPSKKDFIAKAEQGNLIPVYKEILADMETPVSAFMKINTGDYSYLLESVEGGEKIGRYSFLGSDPSLVFKSKGLNIEVVENKHTSKFKTTSDPLIELKKILARYKFVPVKGLPRFCGGLVGYFSYDMVRFFEELPDNNPDDLDLDDSVFVLTDTILIFDRVSHTIKVVSNAHVTGSASRAYEEALKKIEKLIKQLRSTPVPHYKQRFLEADNLKTQKTSSLKVDSNFTKKEFEGIVCKAKKYIRAGDIVQTVLSQRFQTKLKCPAFDIYRTLRSINPSPYMYYLKFKELDIIGSSPEIMVRCEDRKVEVRPIAGTRPRGRDESEDIYLAKDLLKDPKERAEHIMLVDLGRNDIGRVCDYGTVKVPELMVIEKYSHVMHIVSDTTGRLKKDKDVFDVIRATFPAGTVSGAPKIRAMEIIDELEKTRRGPYAGCVGYFSFSGNLDTCITIRTVVVKDNKAYVQAGAGIVADSVPAAEYTETKNKARGMIKAIEIASRG